MQFESSLTIQASAADVFAFYADVANWPTWDVDAKAAYAKAASIQGAFVSGAVGEIVPHGGPKSKLYFTEVRQNQGFTVMCKLPLCEMRFEYGLAEQGKKGGEVVATHRAVFVGLLAPIFGRLIGSGMRKTFPQSLQKLKALAEAAAASKVVPLRKAA